MPRVKRKALGRTGYTAQHFDELMSGAAYFGPCFDYDRFQRDANSCAARGGTPEDVADARALFDDVAAETRGLWNDSRDWLLDEWIHEEEPAGIINNGERNGPCTRPWAWWEFDAPEPRRQLSDGPPNSTMQDDHPSGGLLSYGVPRYCAASTDWDIEYESTG